ncbi:chalcone isomerase family protein [Caballeronia cordobensis]|uniref:chalcone isomerase family protein n=1 Tax=Caballeronia cordobensis TaxID=1353886 RepID=UPI001F488519|nr:chalcone isomerase family protein [Caballeronia cordobensis]
MSGVIVLASASAGCARKRDLFHSIALRAEKFALTVERSRLIETAIDEIRRRQTPVPSDETLAQWQRAMTPAFPDVTSGDTLCGVYLPDCGARFYVNGRLTTEVDDPAFARAFSDIWQAPGTRPPALRHHLLRESQ